MSIKLNVHVESYDVQPNGNIKISSLLKFFQKAAGDDVNTTDLNYYNLAGHNIAFVLTKMTLQIIRDIKQYDDITVISHPRKVRGVSFPRDFIVKIGDETVAVATSVWVLIDLGKRTILRPSAISDIGDLPPSDADLFEIPDIRRNPSADSLFGTNVLNRVEYSHLDMNNHLNNTFYSDFIFNLIPIEVHKNSDVGLYLQINYKTEGRLGDTLDMRMAEYSADKEYDICALKPDGKVCFTAYVKYN